MIEFHVKVDDQPAQRMLDAVRAKIPTLQRWILSRVGEEITGFVGNFYLTGQALHVQSGRLRKSIDYKFEGPAKIMVGTNVKYGRIHEEGGTISAKPGKALAVPVHPQAKQWSARGRSPREMADLVYIPRKGKPPLLVKIAGRGGNRWQIMYVLLKSVRMPARPWLSPAVQTYFMGGRADNAIDKATADWIAAVERGA